MREEERNLRVEFSDEIFRFKSALVGGRLLERKDHYTSLYCGPLNLDEIHNALFYSHCAVIRLLTEEFNIDLDEIEDFLLSALTESMVSEYNARTKGRNNEIRKIVKTFRNNQN